MAPRTIYLVSSRNAARQRAHFSIFVPSAADPKVGTLIHAIGAPMAGYRLEFKRNYSPDDSLEAHQTWAIGEIDSQHIVDSTGTERTKDSIPRGNIEKVASQCPTPRISENFMAPVDGIKNKRCQEWTKEFVGRLAQLGYIGQNAVDIVQSHRDPPGHGIGLQPAGRGRGGGDSAGRGGAALAPTQGGRGAAGEHGGSNTGSGGSTAGRGGYDTGRGGLDAGRGGSTAGLGTIIQDAEVMMQDVEALAQDRT